MHQFDEHHPEFKGFSAFYKATVLPELRRQEIARLHVMNDMKRAGLALGGVGVIVSIGGIFYGASVALFIFIVGLLGVSMMGASSYFISDVKAATKDNIMGGVCRFLGWEFSDKTDHAPHFDSFLELGLLPNKYNRESFEDLVTGSAHGAMFELYEAHLEKRHQTENGETYTTEFQGQLIALEFNQKFHGRTVVLRDEGWLQKKKKGDMKRVGLVDPVFEKIFEAYGTDQVEARYLLTPTFMQRLVDLEKSVDGKKIRFGFNGGLLLIAIETGNRYEVGSMFNPLTETARTQKVLDEIGAIFEVIDGVIKREPRRA